MFNRKTTLAALVALGTLAAGGAHAANVQWSVSVNLPPVATVITGVPAYPAPVYSGVPVPVYQPGYPAVPVYRAPVPAVVLPPPPVPVVYRPAPPNWQPGYAPRAHEPRGHRGPQDRWDDRRDGRGPGPRR